MEVLASALKNQMIQNSIPSLRNISLFIRNLTIKFNLCYLTGEIQAVIVGTLIQMLYLDDSQTEDHAAHTLANILSAPRNDSFVDSILKHE
jgi:hypothetical protein